MEKIICKYDGGYAGKCKRECKPNMNDDIFPYCERHLGLLCAGCKQQATHMCCEASSLVCGAPLCDNCEHKYEEGRSLGHGRKQNI